MNGLKQLAIEAGFPVSSKYDGIGYVWCSDEYPIDEQLQRFANLVAAAERETCAKVAAWVLKMPENDVSAAIRARGSDAA